MKKKKLKHLKLNKKTISNIGKLNGGNALTTNEFACHTTENTVFQCGKPTTPARSCDYSLVSMCCNY
ncbi:hypothetical protein [uncultured Lacinutrix sp.]|uniref:hypothetical protein n=1 Tax=uncultured Lacinutrix sp. TaxID=574032 RepID=UPI00260AFCE5|nr:hypothetical protein [uncultured Lacinutrix sp.]